MTYEQALHQIDELRPSEYSKYQLARWLCTIDGQLMLDYVAQYASQQEMDDSYDGMGVQAGIDWIIAAINEEDDTGDNWVTLMDMELQAVKAPYEDLYLDYVCMEIDLHNADYERSNNDMALYSSKLVKWLDRLSRRNWHNLDKFDPQTGRRPTVLVF